MGYDDGRGLAPRDPSPEQLARAQEQRVLPVFPESLGDPSDRLIRAQPRSPLADSYRSQCYRFEDVGNSYLLAPGTAVGPSEAPPFDLPVHMVTGWHPGGAPSTLADCRAAQDRLIAGLAASGRPYAPATAVAEDLTWFEGVLLVSGLDDDQAVDLATEAGQPAAIRWDSTSLVVLPTRRGAHITTSASSWRLESTMATSCPVRRDDDPAGRCTSHGGPYGSRSIHAAALWQAHRSVAVSMLGCGPCHNGMEPIWGTWGGGRGLSLAGEIIGSRYGGYTWRQP